MGAELSAFEHARILIPIVSRNEYQVALRAMSRDGRCDLYIRTLAWAWRWTSGMPWHDRATRLVAAPSTAPRFAALEQLICGAHRFASRAGLCSQRLSPTTFARESYHCPRTPGLRQHEGANMTGMERVQGIGGVFFKAHDPDLLNRWYAEHLALGSPQATLDES